MITAILIVLALLWISCIAAHLRVSGVWHQIDHMCGIEDRQ